jgi:signal transduction histidine kinase
LRISADPDQLQQVVTNVTLNAIQASREGGAVEVVVEKSRSRRPAAIDEVDCVVVRITDRGVGMSDEEMARAFEPFFTTKPPGQGTGLGLSIVREIVEEHGGWASVSSSRDEGTRFELYFPERTTHAS